VVIHESDILIADVELSGQNQTVAVVTRINVATQQGSGGERLSSSAVSSLPLNERDFSKLLLLAAGTMTDTNGAANFTQQFTVDGQRKRRRYPGSSRQIQFSLKLVYLSCL